MVKRITFFVFIFTIAFISNNYWNHIIQESNESIRAEYSTFLAEHPYNNRNYKNLNEWRNILKYDRPDLAMEQNILMTMDPKLKRVPYERLQAAYEAAEASRQSQPLPKTDGSSFNWQERGPINVGGRTRAVMYDPNDGSNQKVWAGGVAGGLWYTNNITAGTPTWTNVGDFWDNIAITCITYDPTTSTICSFVNSTVIPLK